MRKGKIITNFKQSFTKIKITYRHKMMELLNI
jgi:hypothetical protein